MQPDIPKNKNHPTDAVQCDICGGYGCETCENNGWLPAGHAAGRLCLACRKSIPPSCAAIYCSSECALADADGSVSSAPPPELEKPPEEKGPDE